MANFQSDVKGTTLPKDLCSKEMSKIFASLHVMIGCYVTSRCYVTLFGAGKRTVWKRVQKNTEAQMFLTDLSHKYHKNFVIKYVYKDKVSTTLTEIRVQKLKNMKIRKAKSFARIGPVVGSNFHRNERFLYHTHVLLNFQNPASPICPRNNCYKILNRLCMPIVHLKSPLPDELVKRVNHNFKVDNTDPEDDDDNYSSSDNEFDDELLI